jgi:hypothetical protein
VFTICQVVYSDTDCEELRRKHFVPFIIDGMRLMRLETRNLCFTNAIKQQREDKQAAALLAVTRQTIARTAQAVADRSLWSTVVQVVSPSQSSAMRSTNKFPKLIASPAPLSAEDADIVFVGVRSSQIFVVESDSEVESDDNSLESTD